MICETFYFTFGEIIGKLKIETSKFDLADYLDNQELMAEYLNTVFEEGNNTDVINAIGHITKAIGAQTQVNPITP